MKKSLIFLAAAALILSACGANSDEEKLAEYEAWEQEFMESYRSRIVQLSDDPVAAEAYNDSVYAAYLDYNKAAFEGNLDNLVGFKALKAIYNDLEPGELEEALGKLSVKLEPGDSAFVADLKESVVALKATAEGQPFADFEVDGVKFSDYIGQGKYILVDFWASWCGPCRGEIPNLKAVYEEFHGPKFDLLSVAVWDDPEDTKQAAEEEAIPWNQIINAQRIPTELYGIQGIPQIILFGPDGTILKRNLRGPAIREAVAAALAD